MIKVSKKHLIYAGIGLVLIAGQVLLARFIIGSYLQAVPGDAEAVSEGAAAPAGKPPQEAAREKERKKEVEEREEVGEIYLIKDIVVNPAGTEGRRYVSLNIAIEVGSETSVSDIERNEPIIRDIIIRLIVQKTIDELDGREEIDILKYQILRALSRRFGEGVVRHIYLDNYVLQ
jgi:flagellar basal body-associated protein FliL